MLALVGKSCSGKNTIRDILVSSFNMDPVITHTTRPPRNGEENYVDYIFVSKEHFNILDGEGWFAEKTAYKVADGDIYNYASTWSDYEDSENKVVILNPMGIETLRKKGVELFVVEISAPRNERKMRLMKRGDNQTEAERRMNADDKDFANFYSDGVFINNDDPYDLAKTIYQLYQTYLRRNNVENKSRFY